jgi:hypothetical protein
MVSARLACRARLLQPLNAPKRPQPSCRSIICYSGAESDDRIQADVQTESSGSGNSVCNPTPLDQEQIGLVASIVLDRARAVLKEKLEEYQEQLHEVESAADRNIVYRCRSLPVVALLHMLPILSPSPAPMLT